MNHFPGQTWAIFRGSTTRRAAKRRLAARAGAARSAGFAVETLERRTLLSNPTQLLGLSVSANGYPVGIEVNPGIHAHLLAQFQSEFYSGDNGMDVAPTGSITFGWWGGAVLGTVSVVITGSVGEGTKRGTVPLYDRPYPL